MVYMVHHNEFSNHNKCPDELEIYLEDVISTVVRYQGSMEKNTVE